MIIVVFVHPYSTLKMHFFCKCLYCCDSTMLFQVVKINYNTRKRNKTEAKSIMNLIKQFIRKIF